MIGYPTYFHARISENMLQGIFFYDPLSFQGREFYYPPLFHMLLAVTAFLFNITTTKACVILPPLLGGISAVMLYKILGKLGYTHKFITTLAFLSIPWTIYTFGHCNSRVLAFLLGLISLYYLMCGQKNKSTLSLILGIIAHPIQALFFILVNLLYILFKGNSFTKTAKAYLATPLLFFLLFHIMIFLQFGIPGYNLLHEQYLFTDGSSLHTSDIRDLFQISEKIGALSISITLFSLIGLRRRNPFVISILLIALPLSILAERFRIFLPLAVILLFAESIKTLKERISRKKIYLLLIIIILASVYQSLSLIELLSNIGPSNCLVNLFISLRANTDENSCVMVNPPWGHWTEYFTGRKTFMDAFAEYTPEADERTALLRKVFCGNIDKQEIQKFNITHILYYEGDYWLFKNMDCEINLNKPYLKKISNLSCGYILTVE